MLKKITCLLTVFALAGWAGAANATLIVDTYGDIDGGPSSSGFLGTITDQTVRGDESWSQSFTLDGSVSSASITVGHWWDGWKGLGLSLLLDDVLVGTLTDLDGTGPGDDPGCEGTSIECYAEDVFDLTTILAGSSTGFHSVTLLVEANNQGDAWGLDYSEIRINTLYEGGQLPPPPGTNIPTSSTIALFGLGLAGLGFARRKKA